MSSFLLIYLAAGALAGLLAGLMGLGGGIVIVPMLNLLFSWQNMPPELIQLMALGTSMASIMFTSVSSFRAHHKRGAVLWRIVFRIAPGIVIGAFLGTRLASFMPVTLLRGTFAVFLALVSIQMFLNLKPNPTREFKGVAGITLIGFCIGLVSGLVGIGGGSLSVPTLTWHNVAMHTAVGTSSAIGLPIAVAGAIGYIINGWGNALLPQFSLGYVYLPALICLVATSVLTAPLGVRLAHRLPVPRLKKIFGVLFLLLAFRMLMLVF